MLELNEMIELSHNDEHLSEITKDKLIQAKAIIGTTPKNNKELLNVLVAMNLINAALKRNEFKSKEKDALIHYGLLKPRVNRLFLNLIENRQNFNIDYYINQQDQCAYIEIEELQFSFHNISINDSIKDFIESEDNKPKHWKGVRLQKIAGELFDYAINKQEA